MGTAISDNFINSGKTVYSFSRDNVKMKLTQEATVHGIDVAFILLQY